MLLPRLRDLVDAHYPGTGIALTEWNWGALDDSSGGLAVADVLGIFGREGIDVATMWTSADAASPASAAFRLYRNTDRPFATRSLTSTVSDPDLLGVYGAVDDDGTTIVVVNKDPHADASVAIAGLPVGTATLRHFGGALEGTVVDDLDVELGDVVIVPAYAAVFLSIAGAGPDDTGNGPDDSGEGVGGGDNGGLDDTANAAPADAQGDNGCGCGSRAPMGWGSLCWRVWRSAGAVERLHGRLDFQILRDAGFERGGWIRHGQILAAPRGANLLHETAWSSSPNALRFGWTRRGRGSPNERRPSRAW